MPEEGGKNRVYTKYRSNNGALRAIRSAVTIITKQFRFYIMLFFFFFLWLRNNFSPNLFLLEIYFIFFRIFSRYASKKKNAINYRFYTNDLHRRFNLSNLFLSSRKFVSFTAYDFNIVSELRDVRSTRSQGNRVNRYAKGCEMSRPFATLWPPYSIYTTICKKIVEERKDHFWNKNA